MRRCTAQTVAAAAAVFFVLTTMPGTAGAQDGGVQSTARAAAHTAATQHRATESSANVVPHTAQPPLQLVAEQMPAETLSPVTSIESGGGIDIGPVLAVIDAAGLVALAYLVKRRTVVPGA